MVELKLIDPELLERAARAAYYECIQAYAEMTPLDPNLEVIAQELSERLDVWERLKPELREHWKRIVARAFAEAIGDMSEPTIDLAGRLASLMALQEHLPASARDDLTLVIHLFVETWARDMPDQHVPMARAADRLLALADDVPELCALLASSAEVMRLLRGRIS